MGHYDFEVSLYGQQISLEENILCYDGRPKPVRIDSRKFAAPLWRNDFGDRAGPVRRISLLTWCM